MKKYFTFLKVFFSIMVLGLLIVACGQRRDSEPWTPINPINPVDNLTITPNFECSWDNSMPSNLTVKFVDTSVVEKNGDNVTDNKSSYITANSWDFNDPYSDESIGTGDNVSYSYQRAGKYSVTLTLTDVKDKNYSVSKDCVIPSNISEIKTFMNSTFIKRNDGTLFVLGDNSKGWLGVNTDEATHKLDNITSPYKVSELPPISIFAFSRIGDGQFLGFNDHNHPKNFLGLGVSLDHKTIYYWGNISENILHKGGDGCENAVSDSICSVKMPEELKGVKSLKVGENYVLIEGKNGFLYSFGVNKFGQLGQGSSVNHDDTFHTNIAKVVLPNGKLDFYETIDDVNYASVDNVTYGWGHNNGEVSNTSWTSSYYKDYCNYLLIKGFQYDDKGETLIHDDGIVDTPSSGDVSDSDFHFTKIFLGSSYEVDSKGYQHAYRTFAIGSDGNLYSWGSNNSRDLGNGGEYDSHEHMRFMAKGKIVIDNPDINKVSTSGLSLIFDNRSKKLYSWGDNGSYLGRTSSDYGNTVDLVNTDNLDTKTFTDNFTAFKNNGFVFDNEGGLWSWGENSSILGQDVPDKVDIPDKVKYPSGDFIPDEGSISVGNEVVYILDSAHLNLIGWGSNANGQLGFPGTSGDSKTPIKLNIAELLTE